jgi:tetratricopeptide (TPR) repeat protein
MLMRAPPKMPTVSADGVAAEHAQGVDLLGHHHRAELRRHRRSHAAGDHEGGEHGPQLAHHRDADEPADVGPRAEGIEGRRRLERQHHAGEHAGQDHDRERAYAEAVHLAQGVGDGPRRRHYRSQRVPGKDAPLLHGEKRAFRKSVDAPSDAGEKNPGADGHGGLHHNRSEMSAEERLEKAAELFQSAFHAQMNGELDTAVALYKRSIELYPTAEAHTFLGWTYSFQGSLDDAIAECKKAIEVDPDFGNPYNDIGAYLIELGRLDDAIPWLEKASRAPRYEAPHYPHFNLGRVYVAKEMYNRAIEEFSNALGLRPDYDLARKAVDALKLKLN